MANSKYEYVKEFEINDDLLRNTWVVVRIDGRGFHKFSSKYDFEKPNDVRALDLMNAAAVAVMKELPDLVLGYGVSDEYSFVFHKDCALFERRASKLMTTVVSTFTAYYVGLWSEYFPGVKLAAPMPTFDGRCVCYPTVGNLRDYMSWRQVDCHINNLYNTTFWALIQKGGMNAQDSEQKLSGTIASDKNEILFQLGINYNNEAPIFKKGTVLYRNYELQPTLTGSTEILETVVSDTEEISSQPAKLSKTALQQEKKSKSKAGIAVEHLDIIKNEFWQQRSWILSGRAGRLKASVGVGERSDVIVPVSVSNGGSEGGNGLAVPVPVTVPVTLSSGEVVQVGNGGGLEGVVASL